MSKHSDSSSLRAIPQKYACCNDREELGVCLVLESLLLRLKYEPPDYSFVLFSRNASWSCILCYTRATILQDVTEVSGSRRGIYASTPRG